MPRLLRELVNPRVGVIRRIERLSRGPLEPTPPYIAQATLAHFDYRKVPAGDRSGTGRGLTEAGAIDAAIGEAMERYCAGQPQQAKFVRAPYEAVRAHAVAPPEFGLYSERQYECREIAFPRWDPQREISWVWARRLTDGERVLVPSSLVYLDYVGNYAETYYCDGTSSGLAAGPTLESATLSALLELVERDAYVTTWLHRLPAREIALDDIEERTRQVVARYARQGIETRAFLLAGEFSAPVVFAMLLGSDGAPALVSGLGCAFDPREALWRAVSEASQGHPGQVVRCAQTKCGAHLKRYEDVQVIEDHAAFFFDRQRLPELEFMLRESKPVRLSSQGPIANSKAEQLRELVAEMARCGYDPMVVEITTPDLVNFPIHVVRTLVPGLQPIQFGFGHERLGCERLYRVPQLLGFSTRRAEEHELNYCPHPLS